MTPAPSRSSRFWICLGLFSVLAAASAWSEANPVPPDVPFFPQPFVFTPLPPGSPLAPLQSALRPALARVREIYESPSGGPEAWVFRLEPADSPADVVLVMQSPEGQPVQRVSLPGAQTEDPRLTARRLMQVMEGRWPAGKTPATVPSETGETGEKPLIVLVDPPPSGRLAGLLPTVLASQGMRMLEALDSAVPSRHLGVQVLMERVVRRADGILVEVTVGLRWLPLDPASNESPGPEIRTTVAAVAPVEAPASEAALRLATQRALARLSELRASD